MHSVLAETRAELLQTKLFPTGLALQRVVVIAGFFANEMDDLFLFLALRHD